MVHLSCSSEPSRGSYFNSAHTSPLEEMSSKSMARNMLDGTEDSARPHFARTTPPATSARRGKALPAEDSSSVTVSTVLPLLSVMLKGSPRLGRDGTIKMHSHPAGTMRSGQKSPAASGSNGTLLSGTPRSACASPKRFSSASWFTSMKVKSRKSMVNANNGHTVDKLSRESRPSRPKKREVIGLCRLGCLTSWLDSSTLSRLFVQRALLACRSPGVFTASCSGPQSSSAALGSTLAANKKAINAGESQAVEMQQPILPHLCRAGNRSSLRMGTRAVQMAQQR
mmetsp:Transcript_83889/g.171094  ORF Transcript_83889/g.171094 Transcript_83889/m.171094 type:complete len:283 (+) Transcript_83889:269-1117(+)